MFDGPFVEFPGCGFPGVTTMFALVGDGRTDVDQITLDTLGFDERDVFVPDVKDAMHGVVV